MANEAFEQGASVVNWNVPPPAAPPWSDDCPDTHAYLESELFVAGRLSTMGPFAQYHPAFALPFARAALDALGQWTPSE